MGAKIKRILTLCTLFACAAGAVYTGSIYLKQTMATRAELELIEEVKSEVFSERKPSLDFLELETPEDNEEPTPPTINFDALKCINEDCAGWLVIPDTSVNVPVMYRSGDNQHYLHRAVDDTYAEHGTPFIDGGCSLDKNLIIYGHNMTDKAAFHELMSYKKQEFCEEHPYLNLYIGSDLHVYELFAVCRTAVYSDYNYYKVSGLEGDEAFDAYVSRARRESLFDSAVVPASGERLLMLSTCEYSQTNGRLVVLYREIPWIEYYQSVLENSKEDKQ